MKIKEADAPREDLDSCLEELIVRRELSNRFQNTKQPQLQFHALLVNGESSKVKVVFVQE